MLTWRAVAFALAPCAILLGLALLSGFLEAFGARFEKPLIFIALLGSLGCSVYSILLAGTVLFRLDSGPGATALAVFSILFGLFGAALTSLFLFFTLAGFPHGRSLRSRGRPRQSRLEETDLWLSTETHPCASAERIERAAAAWRQNGLTEHASIAAFAALSSDLLALGAPARLIREAHEDALDEIRHAELCFSIARSMDGATLSPGPLRAARGPRAFGPRPVTRARVAVASLIDGALYEGTSARTLAQLARRAPPCELRDRLRRLAGDEARHAAHAWHIIAWCLEEGGPLVRAALRGAVVALSSAPEMKPAPISARGDLEEHGIASASREAEAFEVVRKRSIARAERLLVHAASGSSAFSSTSRRLRP